MYEAGRLLDKGVVGGLELSESLLLLSVASKSAVWYDAVIGLANTKLWHSSLAFGAFQTIINIQNGMNMQHPAD